MSQRVMEAIMQRAADEPGCRAELIKCPSAVLGAYLLTRPEKAALLSGDRKQLVALGMTAAAARGWTALDGLS